MHVQLPICVFFCSSGLVLEDKDIENGLVMTVSEDIFMKGCVQDVNEGLQVWWWWWSYNDGDDIGGGDGIMLMMIR